MSVVKKVLQVRRDKKINTLVSILRNGCMAVIPTDTIYGLVAQVNDARAVKKVQKAKRRPAGKLSIILISNLVDLKKFNISLPAEVSKGLKRLWPGKVSVEFPSSGSAYSHIHRNAPTISFRLPKNKQLLSILKRTGPLIAPSANPNGEPPAKNITEAKRYFGNSVDFYLPGRKLSGKPSTLIRFDENGSIVVLREGAVKIKS